MSRRDRQRMFPPTKPGTEPAAKPGPAAPPAAAAPPRPPRIAHPAGIAIPRAERGPIFPQTRGTRPLPRPPGAAELEPGAAELAAAGQLEGHGELSDDHAAREAARLERRRGHIEIIEKNLATAHRFVNGMQEKAAELEGIVSQLGARLVDLQHSIEVLEVKRDTAEQALRVLEARAGAAGEHAQNEDDKPPAEGEGKPDDETEPHRRPRKPR